MKRLGGSWATCGGAVCVLPPALPPDHPPTLFLHGALDPVVPVSTLQLCADVLQGQGTQVLVITGSTAGHEWLPEAPQAVPDWFTAQR